MGCGATRIGNDLLNNPLDFNMRIIPCTENEMLSEIEMINKLYTKASDIMGIIEDLREKIVDKLDYLILQTGACLFTQPDIVACMRCIMYKISADCMGSFDNAEIKYFDDDPFFEIKSELLSEETKQIIDLLYDYISDIHYLRTRMTQTENEIPELVYIISEKNEKVSKNLQSIAINNKKIQTTLEMFPELKVYLKDTIYKCRYEVALLKKDPDHIKLIEMVGQEANKLKITNIHQIVFMIKKLNNEKLGSEFIVKSLSYGKSKYLSIIHSKKKIKEEIEKGKKIRESSE